MWGSVKFHQYICLLCICVFVVTACSASQVVQSWVNPDARRPSKIVVFGVTKQESLRRSYEDKLSQALSSEGLQAVPSYTILPEEGEVEKGKVEQVVRKAGADAVFITRLVRLTKELESVPAPTPMWGPGFGGWGGFYGPYWSGYYYDSYRLIERDFAYIESNLYDEKNNALILGILTRTEEPNYSEAQVKQLAQLIVKEFRKRGLLGPRI